MSAWYRTGLVAAHVLFAAIYAVAWIGTAAARPLGNAQIPDCTIGVSFGIAALAKTIHKGRSSTLTWHVIGPTGCPYDVFINGSPVTASGTMTVSPAVTTQYDLSYQVSLIILSPRAPPIAASTIVTVNPKVVRIKGGTHFWVNKLIAAVGEDGTRVIIEPQVNMDLTDYKEIFIREGVILSSDDGTPPYPVRNGRRLGPRLFTRSRPKPLFIVECNSDGSITGDGVLISGFQLHGPHFGMKDGNDNLEKAIGVASCLDVEITNMDIGGWSGQAIYVSENTDNPRMFNPDAVYIHDNYIHNNQHKGGNGYGVVTQVGAYARIERNVFDLNRHAIASSGKGGTGYLAANNLVLKGGGVHGTLFNSYTHQFDIHGDANCPSTFSHLWNCGNAGDQYWYIDNAFQYRKDTALKIRGKPRVAAYIDGNIFAHGDLDDAIALRTSTNVHLGTGAARNIPGRDSYGRYGVCDLDGDGKDDLFLPTGKTWWSMSSAKMHWVFLKAATERLENVGLGDFNGDGRCDVLAANGSTWYISSGGKGDWTALPGSYPIPFNQLAFADFNGDRRTDVFRRDTNGQWSVVSPGVHVWTLLQSSSFPLSALRFGDFTGDGKADVLSMAGGHWSISRGGTSAWTTLNSLSTGLNSLLIGDINGDGRDDIVRYKSSGLNSGKWQVSWSGRTDWRTLKSFSVPMPPLNPLVTPRVFIGRFDGTAGEDLLHIDFFRAGRVYNYPKKTLLTHNLFPY